MQGPMRVHHTTPAPPLGHGLAVNAVASRGHPRAGMRAPNAYADCGGPAQGPGLRAAVISRAGPVVSPRDRADTGRLSTLAHLCSPRFILGHPGSPPPGHPGQVAPRLSACFHLGSAMHKMGPGSGVSAKWGLVGCINAGWGAAALGAQIFRGEQNAEPRRDLHRKYMGTPEQK